MRATLRERREILRWILFDNHKFTSYFATLRWFAGIQKAGDPAVIEFLRGRAKSAFAIVDKHLAGRAFMVGERPTIADLSMVGYLYYPEEDRDRPIRYAEHRGVEQAHRGVARLEASLRSDAARTRGLTQVTCRLPPGKEEKL